ncbi:MAG: response regulator [Gemmatimonadetes bacterium]|jgi:CheY-like chemotaxis protein|nr:response regulator [Gemmatimonadota bacterium]
MPRTVLVVDDELEIRRTLRRILERAGIQVTEASNGAEALQHIRTHRYDLVTMDMEMAQMDGVDAVSVIRSEVDTPVLVISAYLTEGVLADLRARDVHHFLRKPFSVNQVLELVEKAMAGA